MLRSWQAIQGDDDALNENAPHIASAAATLSDGQVQVNDVTHWTNRLFSFSTGRPAGIEPTPIISG